MPDDQRSADDRLGACDIPCRQQAAAKPKAFRQYVDIVDLLTHSLNGYAYDSLVCLERRRWEKVFEAGDEVAFTKLFGPDKIPRHLGEFLGYFMIRKVIVPEELTAAAGRITKELVEWLDGRGWIAAADVADAVEHSEDAARDLLRAERLGRLLYQLAQRTGDSALRFSAPRHARGRR